MSCIPLASNTWTQAPRGRRGQAWHAALHGGALSMFHFVCSRASETDAWLNTGSLRLGVEPVCLLHVRMCRPRLFRRPQGTARLALTVRIDALAALALPWRAGDFACQAMKVTRLFGTPVYGDLLACARAEWILRSSLSPGILLRRPLPDCGLKCRPPHQQTSQGGCQACLPCFVTLRCVCVCVSRFQSPRNNAAHISFLTCQLAVKQGVWQPSVTARVSHRMQRRSQRDCVCGSSNSC